MSSKYTDLQYPDYYPYTVCNTGTTHKEFMNITCTNCGIRFGIRLDHYKYRKEHNKGETKCKKCISVQSNGFLSHRGYLVKHYTNYPRQYWPILISMAKGKSGQVYDHRASMAIYLGRALLSTEEVHHINGNKVDNSVENLQLVDVKQHAHAHLLSANIEISELKQRIKELEYLMGIKGGKHADMVE